MSSFLFIGVTLYLYILAVSVILSTHSNLYILDISTKEHEGKGVLEKAETESITDVFMEQKEGLVTGK